MIFNRNHLLLSYSKKFAIEISLLFLILRWAIELFYPYLTPFWLIFDWFFTDFLLDLSPIRSWTWAPILHGWKSQFDKLWIWSPFIQANDTFPGRMLWSQHLILLQLQVAGDFHANTLFFYSSFNAWNFCSGHNYHWNHLVTISTSLLSSITKII